MKRAVNREFLAGPSYSTKSKCVAESLGRVAPTSVVEAYEAWERKAVEDKNAAFALMESINDAS